MKRLFTLPTGEPVEFEHPDPEAPVPWADATEIDEIDHESAREAWRASFDAAKDAARVEMADAATERAESRRTEVVDALIGSSLGLSESEAGAIAAALLNQGA